jgi:hypothetical protein
MKPLWVSFFKTLTPITGWLILHLTLFCLDGYCLYINMLEGDLFGVVVWIILTTFVGYVVYQDYIQIRMLIKTFNLVRNTAKEMMKEFKGLSLMKNETDDENIEDVPHEEIK